MYQHLVFYYRWHRIDNACDSLHQLSASCWGSYKFCEGERNMNPKNGFLSILNALLAETTAVVKLDSEVEWWVFVTEIFFQEFFTILKQVKNSSLGTCHLFITHNPTMHLYGKYFALPYLMPMNLIKNLNTFIRLTLL